MFTTSTTIIIMLLTPFIAALILPVLERAGLSSLREPVSVITGVIIAVLSLSLLGAVTPSPVPVLIYDWMPGLVSYSVVVDALSVTLTLIAGVIGALIVFFSLEYMRGEEGLTRYYSLVLFFIASMIGMTLSDDLIFLFIFWEMIGIASYLLIGFFYKEEKSANAGFKAFLTTKIGDVGLFAGILLLYSATGTFSISKLAAIAQSGGISNNVLFYASMMFMAGAVGKSAQFPLHVWLPDAMEAPTTISALIHAATLVNSGIYLVMRMYPVFLNSDMFFFLALFIGMITALFTATLALLESDLKKLLAYSTVSQLGFMMYALGAHGYFAAQFHLFSHAIFKALLFLSAGAVIHYAGTRNMHSMPNLSKDLPIIKICMAIGFLALAGVPVLNGFWSKDLIIYQGFQTAPLSATLMLLAALFTAAYSMKAFYLLFMKPEVTAKAAAHNHHHGESHHKPGMIIHAPLMILAFFTLISWLFVGYIASGDFNSLPLAKTLPEMLLMKDGMGLGAMVHHTLVSITTYFTLLMIFLGYMLFKRKEIFAKQLNEPSIRQAFSQGMYIDWLYLKLLAFVVFIGRVCIDVFDGLIIDNLNYAIGVCSTHFAERFKKTHSGNLNANIAGLAITLLAVALICRLAQ